MRRLGGWLRVALIDLRGGARRFVILVACLALGVAAIGTVSAVRSSVEAAIEGDARLLLGGDLELRSLRSDIGEEVVTALDRLGPVSREVNLNAQAAANGKTAFLSLRAVTSAYPLVGQVGLAAGSPRGNISDLLANQNGRFGLLLSHQAALRLDADVGATVRVGTLDVELRGIIEALPDQATAGFQLGAPALISSAALAPAGLREEGVLSQFRYKVLLPDGNFEAARGALENAFPNEDWQVRSPREATATISRFIGVFGNFLLLVSLSSMVVGGLGAANAVAAYIGERQGAIATMRSLGAKGSRILFHFLVQIALLSLVAIAIGLALVAAASLVLLPLLSSLIGIDLPPTLDFQAMLAAAAIGLVTALTFSWIPLLQARSIRPAQLFRAGSSSAMERLAWRRLAAPSAIGPLLLGLAALFGLTLLIANDARLVAIYFAATLVALALLRLSAGLLLYGLSNAPVPRLRLLRLAVSAIIRPSAPTTTVLVSMGMGLSLLLLIVTTQSNINDQIATQVSDGAPDFVVLDMDRDTTGALEALVAGSRQVTTLTTNPMLRGVITEINGAPAPSSEDVPRGLADLFRGDTALTWSSEVPPGTVLEEGKWWPADYSGDPLVSLSTDMRDGLQLALGDTITLTIAGRPLTMTVASFRTIDWRSPTFNFRIIVSPGVVESAPQSYFGTITTSPGAAASVEAGLIAALPNLTFVPVGEALARVQSVFDGLVDAIAAVSATAVISGVLVLAGALSVGRHQREADAVVMKVMGARRGFVLRAFLVEYALLGVIAALLSAAIALAGSWAASSFLLDIPFAVQALQIVSLAGAIVIVTMATAAATTWSAMSARPAERLREDG
ncbi:FtsX-like permease family protein [Devosia sp. PTR5]|uniref:FtsX-like permease family protein n=1 Tax=Devosia oryzisoli TaxID=2774138 RepID=A0A927FXP4_9HYPH|nr:FtsX-like permease family protein [Devosia oryzisoli]MBD8065916.1 FtsX-like permease family protein [Devosia oryzisoli]